MAETHELRLKIDAGAAQRGAKDFTAAINSVKAAVRGLERDTSGAFTALKKIRPEIDVTPIKAATAETAKLAAAQTQAGNASDKAAANIQRTALSSASAIRQSEQAAQRLAIRMGDLGNTSGLAQLEAGLTRLKTDLIAASSPLDVRAAKSQFDDLRSSLLQTSVAAEHMRGEQAQLARETDQATRAAAQEAATLDGLRAKYDSIYASSRQYERALGEIAQLEDAGALTSAKAAQARETAAQSMLAASTANTRFGKSARVSGHETAYLAAQFNDIGVMMAAGQSPLTLALQQGTQVSQMLNQMGGKTAILRGLASGFMSMINPVSLVTVGVIAAGAAIVSWMSSSDEATKSFSDSLSDANSKISALQNATDALAGGNLRNLRREYGAVNKELDAHLERLRKVAEYEAISANSDMISSIRSGLTKDGNMFTNDVDAVRRGLNTTNDEARTLLGLMHDVQSARTFETQAAAVTALRKELQGTSTGLGDTKSGAADVLAQLIRAEDAALKLKAAADGSGAAAKGAAGQASNLSFNIGTAADEAARLLQNLGSVPSALAVMGKSVDGQIASLQAANKSLGIQLSEGWTAAAANRRVQLQDMVKEAAKTGQRISVDQVASQYKQIQELEKLGKDQEALRKKLTDANKPATSPGTSRTPQLSAEAKATAELNTQLTGRLTELDKERVALAASASGLFENKEAADAYANASEALGGVVDQTTLAMIKQIDVGVTLNKRLTEAARDPVKEFIKSVPSWQKAAKDIETSAIGGIQSSIHDLITGDFSLDKLGENLLSGIADQIAPLATGELLKGTGLGNLLNKGADSVASFGASNSIMGETDTSLASGGAQAGQTISAAMLQAGQQVAAQLSQAMTQGGVSVGAQAQQGLTTGASQVRLSGQMGLTTGSFQVRAAGTQSGQTMKQGIVSGGGIAAGKMSAAVAGSGAGTTAGGGGIFSSIIGAMGGWGGAISTVAGMLSEGGESTKAMSHTSVPVSMFHNAPHYAEGTHNTSGGGMPAILHPNEAVIPLSRGRKIGVELQGGAQGGTVINSPQTFNITTPDADSFRKSKNQISLDMQRAGQRAAQKNG